MLKIPKGLKKKKKGKKGKHKGDEDLFTPEELEAYRREKALKEKQLQEENEAGQPEGELESPPEHIRDAENVAGNSGTAAPAKALDTEESEKFKALLGGVDSILNKTQRDLDRIKSTSYFQRKPTPSELEKRAGPVRPAVPSKAAVAAASGKGKKKRWVGFEEGQGEESEEEDDQDHKDDHPEPATQQQPEAQDQPFEEEEESEEEDDDADDIFDTSYIDVITSGEVKLAYIPDSPTEEQADDEDPFDTSYAEKIIGKEDPKKKKLVSLGCAVEVLTGKVEKPERPPPLPELATAKKRPRAVPRRVKPADLLLSSFDEGGDSAETKADEPADDSKEPPVSLLDDDTLLAIPEDLPPVGTPIVPPVLAADKLPQSTTGEEEKEEETEQPVDLSEFDVIGDAPVDLGPVSNVALVAAALGVKVEEELEDELEDEFAALAAESLQKKREEDDEFGGDGDDPFDTSIAAVALGEPERPPTPPKPKNPVADVDILLAGPPAHWSEFDDEEDRPQVGLKPNRPPPPRPAPPPQSANPQPDEDVDPFDTSIAQNILPGKTELKFIEHEILGNPSIEINEARILSNSDSDFDFNPREGEEVIKQPENSGSDVELRPIRRDFLGGSTTDLTQLGDDPIQPSTEVTQQGTDIPEVEDPFDTSAVDTVAAPGKAELKYLEKEILGDVKEVKLQRKLSDEDFDPRAGEPSEIPQVKVPRPDILVVNSDTSVHKSVAFALPSPANRPDLLGTGHEEGSKFSKPLTPYYAEVPPPGTEPTPNEDLDPFDTTHVSNLAPGKVELQILENELVGDAQPTLKHSLSDPDFNPRELSPTSAQQAAKNRRESQDLFVVEEDVGHKPLTPAVEEAVDVDPFDTSIANNLGPGKAELKILEKELISGELPQATLKRTYTDPDFNPRTDPPKEEIKDLLNQPEEVDGGVKPLSPILGVKVDSLENAEDDIDPFDTSIASDIGPGKTELRILESELIDRH